MASTLDQIESLVTSQGLLLARVDIARENLILQRAPASVLAAAAEEEEEESETEEITAEEDDATKDEQDATKDEQDATKDEQAATKDEEQDATKDEQDATKDEQDDAPQKELEDDSSSDEETVCIPLDALRQLNNTNMQLQLWKGMAIGFCVAFMSVIFYTC